MEMLGLILLLGLIASLILPWVNLGRINGQRSELERLKRELWELQRKKGGGVDLAQHSKGAQKPKPTPEAKPKLTPAPAVKAAVAPPEKRESVPQKAASEVVKSTAMPSRGSKRPAVQVPVVEDSEPAEPQDWFSKIAVWVGGVALLMAGFYMIKYSIDSGWLTPAVRIWLTAGFGALLCGAGFVIGIKSSLAANERIGQALSGAGIACLYFAAYAAVHLYSFLSPGQGFVAMLVVTVLAVALSLKNGAPMAMMGMLGGFLTPWLMSTGSNDTVMLFSYLFLLFCGAQFLCISRGWWGILLGSLVAAYIWSAVVIVGYVSGSLDHLEGTLVFVLGICFVNAAWAFFAKEDALDESAKRLLIGVRLMTWGGGLVQGLILVLVGGFASVDMALFSLLSVGALVLAVLKEDEFIWAAWLAFIAVAASALSNTDVALWSWLIVPLGLMGLFFGVGHWRGLSSKRALIWRALSIAAALIVVPLLYLNREYIVSVESSVTSSAWLWMAAVWAGLLALAGEHLFRRESDARMAGEYSAFAVFLLAFGLWTYVPAEYHAHGVAALLIAAALYWKQRNFGRSTLVTSVLGLVWAKLMYVHAGSACAYFFGEDLYNAPSQDGLAVVAWGLGLAGIAVAAVSFRRTWPEKSLRVVTWGIGIVGLLGFVATYQWLDETHMPSSWSSAVVEGGLSALFSVAAVVSIYFSRKWESCRLASTVLVGLVGIRVVILHLGDSGAEGESFFLNALLLQFGVPFVAACILAWISGEGGFDRLRKVYQLAAMLLGFVWVTFLVQDYYGGSELFGGQNSSTEIYTYSVVWLLLAVVYQAIGLWRDQSSIHLGSLILLLVTIGKVFLVDASELEGLFRVLSFLGLGLALIGIGFFYNKVVFARREAVSTENS